MNCHWIEAGKDANGGNRFPKQPKAAIKDTLDTVAERIGPKEGEKKWVLKIVP